MHGDTGPHGTPGTVATENPAADAPFVEEMCPFDQHRLPRQGANSCGVAIGMTSWWRERRAVVVAPPLNAVEDDGLTDDGAPPGRTMSTLRGWGESMTTVSVT